jgi:hypothetical protein
MMEVMLTDLPHIQYNPKIDTSISRQQMLTDISRKRYDDIKKQGLQSVMNVKINDNAKVIDGNALLQQLKTD